MSYTACVLTEESQNKLKEVFEELVPLGWSWAAHHMTCYMGPPRTAEKLGKKIQLVIHEFAINERVCAVKVSQGKELTVNALAHITLAVNRKVGAKPKESNNLKDFTPLNQIVDHDFLILDAVIEECL